MGHEIIFTEEQIQQEIANAAFLMNTYNNNIDVLLCTLKGAVPFCADLTKRLTFDFELEYIRTKSYHRDDQQINCIVTDLSPLVMHKSIAIIEDFIDSGATINKILAELEVYDCTSVLVLSLLKRKSFTDDLMYKGKRVPLGYCFEVESDQWLIGYGLDSNNKKRHLPYIYIETNQNT